MRTEKMKSNEMMGCGLIELTSVQLQRTTAGSGPIREALEWYYKTMGSFYRGVWDGLTGEEAKV
jgi:hypothetical protein